MRVPTTFFGPILENPFNIGEVIKEILKKQNLRVKELADIVGISESAIYKKLKNGRFYAHELSAISIALDYNFLKDCSSYVEKNLQQDIPFASEVGITTDDRTTHTVPWSRERELMDKLIEVMDENRKLLKDRIEDLYQELEE